MIMLIESYGKSRKRKPAPVSDRTISFNVLDESGYERLFGRMREDAAAKQKAKIKTKGSAK
jgi:hypothetical protein